MEKGKKEVAIIECPRCCAEEHCEIVHELPWFGMHLFCQTNNSFLRQLRTKNPFAFHKETRLYVYTVYHRI